VHQTDIAGGNNKVVVQYGNGASSDFSAGYRRPGTSFSAVPGKRFVEGQWRFRLLDAVMFQPHEMFSLMGVALFQRTDHASVLAGGVVDWYSFGVRPTFHASEHVSFSLEGGVDYVDAPRGVPEHDIQEPISDHVTKVTFAPQLTGGNKILSRPALRAYVTYARWGDDYVGHVARAAYADDNQGLGAGVQLESEW
jgi:maltoporin